MSLGLNLLNKFSFKFHLLLQVIYYTIASYSEDGELPEREVLVNEFNVYKNASTELAVSANNELKVLKSKFDDAKKEFDRENKLRAKNLISARFGEIDAISLI